MRDPKTENSLQAVYKAMREVIAATSLPMTGLAVGAVNDITDGERRPLGVVRLLVLAQLDPLAAASARRLVDLIIADLVPEIRAVITQMKP